MLIGCLYRNLLLIRTANSPWLSIQPSYGRKLHLRLNLGRSLICAIRLNIDYSPDDQGMNPPPIFRQLLVWLQHGQWTLDLAVAKTEQNLPCTKPIQDGIIPNIKTLEMIGTSSVRIT